MWSAYFFAFLLTFLATMVAAQDTSVSIEGTSEIPESTSATTIVPSQPTTGAVTTNAGVTTTAGLLTSTGGQSTPVATKQTVKPGDCPPGWVKSFANPKKCFFTDNMKIISWFSAYRECANMSATLLTITNGFENAEVRDLVGFAGFWLGLEKSTKSSDGWNWVDGSNSTYRNWAPGNPGSSSGSFVRLESSNGKWFVEEETADWATACQIILP